MGCYDCALLTTSELPYFTSSLVFEVLSLPIPRISTFQWTKKPLDQRVTVLLNSRLPRSVRRPSKTVTWASICSDDSSSSNKVTVSNTPKTTIRTVDKTTMAVDTIRTITVVSIGVAMAVIEVVFAVDAVAADLMDTTTFIIAADTEAAMVATIIFITTIMVDTDKTTTNHQIITTKVCTMETSIITHHHSKVSTVASLARIRT